MKCQNCGAEVTEGRFCSYCGSELPKESALNIKGNANIVKINNYYTADEQPHEYIEPELEEFIPRDFEPYKRSIIMKSYAIFTLALIIFLGIGIYTFATGIIGVILLCLLAKKLYDSYQQAYADFYNAEYRREDAINERNYRKEYDAWFNSLSEAEKQTELLKQIVEEQTGK